MSDLSMKQKDHPSHNVPDATQHYSGDIIDNSIDISNEGEGPYSLGQAIQGERSRMDSEEKQDGTRFHDSGMSAPGRQTGLNERNLDRPARLTPLLKRQK